jgi:hypothetical protein
VALDSFRLLFKKLFSEMKKETASMELSTPMLQMMIQAALDAVTLSKQELAAAPEEQQPDIEEYLMLLGNLQAELKAEYERRRSTGEKMMPYEILSGERRFRKL